MNTKHYTTLTRRPRQYHRLCWVLCAALPCLSFHSLAAAPPPLAGSSVMVGTFVRYLPYNNTYPFQNAARMEVFVRHPLQPKYNHYLVSYPNTPNDTDYSKWWNTTPDGVQQALNRLTLPVWIYDQPTSSITHSLVVATQCDNVWRTCTSYTYSASAGDPSPPLVVCSVTSTPFVPLGTYSVGDLPNGRINLNNTVMCDRQAVVTASLNSLTGGPDVDFGGGVIGRLTLGSGGSNTTTVIVGQGAGLNLQSAITLSAPGGGTPGTYQGVAVLNVTVH